MLQTAFALRHILIIEHVDFFNFNRNYLGITLKYCDALEQSFSTLQCCLLNLLLIIISQYMSSEAIIIEEPLNKPKVISPQRVKQQQFFEVLDEVEQYDSLAYNIKRKYQEAMLSLAAIKFQNPYALNVSSHKCTPAFLKINPEQKLEYGYAEFTNPVDEEQVYPDEYQQHLQIQKECLEKQEALSKLQKKQERQNFCENELLYRFNVVNNRQKVIALSKQFKEIIELLLNQRNLRKKLEERINQ